MRAKIQVDGQTYEGEIIDFILDEPARAFKLTAENGIRMFCMPSVTCIVRYLREGVPRYHLSFDVSVTVETE